MYSLYFDGASKGNPGPAGCGWYIEKDKEKVTEGCKYIGFATNNVAEYTGLVEGLKAALELGIKDLHVHGDSKLIIEQMNDNWKINSLNLIKLFKEAKHLNSQFTTISFKWIDRSLNTIADSLANQSFKLSV